MATRIDDLITPEIFTPYVSERTTQLDALLQSGVVAPMEQLNATENGGAFVNIPFFKANLAGEFEVLSDNKSLTPGKIDAGDQIGVVLRRGRAFEVRDLAATVSGSDPMAAIGNKLAAYIAHQRQIDLLSCLKGVFGGMDVGKDTVGSAAFHELATGIGKDEDCDKLGPTQVANARALLGEQGDKLTTVVMHSKVYYSLVERRAIDFVYKSDGEASGSSTAGSTAQAFDNVSVPTYMGLRVVVSDDVDVDDPDDPKRFGTYFFTEGAIGSGTTLALRTERDRDILAKSDAMSFDLHYTYHPIGASYKSGSAPKNPSPAELSEVGNWELAYNIRNVGIVKLGISTTTL